MNVGYRPIQRQEVSLEIAGSNASPELEDTDALSFSGKTRRKSVSVRKILDSGKMRRLFSPAGLLGLFFTPGDIALSG